MEDERTSPDPYEFNEDNGGESQPRTRLGKAAKVRFLFSVSLAAGRGVRGV